MVTILTTAVGKFSPSIALGERAAVWRWAIVVLIALVSGRGAAVVFNVATGIASAVVGMFSRGIAIGKGIAVWHWRRPAMVMIAVVAMKSIVVVAMAGGGETAVIPGVNAGVVSSGAAVLESTSIDARRGQRLMTIVMDRSWHVAGAVRRRVPLVLGPRVAAVVALVVR